MAIPVNERIVIEVSGAASQRTVTLIDSERRARKLYASTSWGCRNVRQAGQGLNVSSHA